jgi:glucosamine kinase
MIAIVDSGSTKSSWVFVDENNNIQNYRTVGFNPYYQTSDDIYQILQKELIAQLDPSKKVDQVFFYGAGCEADAQRNVVAVALQKAFPQTEVIVDHDLMAACLAVLGNQEGIACIAGTGSNTCHFDGKNIVKNVHSLGLYLGDEGSGGYLGKILARDYVREALPQSVREKFEAFTTDRSADILDKVYTKPFPNRYLASLAPFVIYNQDEKYLFDLAYESFSLLFQNCVSKYDNYQKLPIRFIGSVAAHLKPVLDRVASEHNVTIDMVVGNPMEALTEYHIKNRK